MIIDLIIACEILFWVCVLTGLLLRYVFKKSHASLIAFILAPIADLVLLTAVALDLHHGAVASMHHGLAALYIGISVAYGHRMIAWADAHFSYRFAGGKRPEKLYGMAYTRKTWGDAFRTGIAVIIAGGILLALIAWVNAPERTAMLEIWFKFLGILFAVDFFWAVSYTFWPKSVPKNKEEK